MGYAPDINEFRKILAIVEGNAPPGDRVLEEAHPVGIVPLQPITPGAVTGQAVIEVEIPAALEPYTNEEIHEMLRVAEKKGVAPDKFFQIADELGSAGVEEVLGEGFFLHEGALAGAAIGGALAGPAGAAIGAGIGHLRKKKREGEAAAKLKITPGEFKAREQAAGRKVWGKRLKTVKKVIGFLRGKKKAEAPKKEAPKKEAPKAAPKKATPPPTPKKQKQKGKDPDDFRGPGKRGVDTAKRGAKEVAGGIGRFVKRVKETVTGTRKVERDMRRGELAAQQKDKEAGVKRRAAKKTSAKELKGFFKGEKARRKGRAREAMRKQAIQAKHGGKEAAGKKLAVMRAKAKARKRPAHLVGT